jgi:ComF family protein
LKYKGDLTLGEVLARPLIKLLEASRWNTDVVIPVPLGERRFLERGYNQSALLARPIALAIGKPYTPKGLMKTRETDTQVGLTFAQRIVNVDGAFLADPVYVDRKRVLLIDDVITSGATMESCSDALKIAGATEVYGLSLARSRHFASY